MGTANIPVAVDGTPIPSDDHNALVAALKDVLVPRNASGNAEANAGNLGSVTYPWKRAFITTGDWVCGDVKQFHDFNGLLSPGQGWMKMNGDVVNETNYDAIHGAGSWDEYIGSSPLDGKNLPNMANRYAVGANSTPQDGTSPITKVGNTSHQVALPDHTHTVDAHNHKWRSGTNGYDVSGASSALGTLQVSNAAFNVTVLSGASGSEYTSNTSLTTNNPSAATISHQPESIEVQFWMRII